MNGPRIVCVACQVNEVGAYELACQDCRPQFEAAGLIEPHPDTRIRIGPTDI